MFQVLDFKWIPGQAIFNDNELALVVKVVIKGLASFFFFFPLKYTYFAYRVHVCKTVE